MKRAFQRGLEMRRAHAGLESFSDHVLKDSGIERTDVQRVARETPSVLDRRSEDAPC
jgi:uncharacterized protein YjiS (DUF1127 family)